MSTSNTVLVPRIEGRIQTIRGLRVMIDVDLASLYGVPTKRLNEQVKRNRERFPSDFLFQLTPAEKRPCNFFSINSLFLVSDCCDFVEIRVS